VKALKPDVVLWFDAHADLKDEYLSQPFCHATVARKVRELGVGLIQVGVRSENPEERDFAGRKGVLRFGFEDGKKLLSRIRGKKLYVSVDLDVLDPSVAPGVGNPEPSGASLNTLLSLIDTVSKGCGLVGFDVVEACPLYDGGLACLAAAKIILNILERR
jgi:agmatinase